MPRRRGVGGIHGEEVLPWAGGCRDELSEYQLLVPWLCLKFNSKVNHKRKSIALGPFVSGNLSDTVHLRDVILQSDFGSMVELLVGFEQYGSKG